MDFDAKTEQCQKDEEPAMSIMESQYSVFDNISEAQKEHVSHEHLIISLGL